MEKDPSGTIYAMVVVTTLTEVRSMAVSTSAAFYATKDNGIGHIDDLYTLDPVTAVASLVGPTDFGGIQGLAWQGSTLYAWDCGFGSGTGDGFVTINPTTGAGADVNGAGSGGPIAYVYGTPGNFTWMGSPCTATTMDITTQTPSSAAPPCR